MELTRCFEANDEISQDKADEGKYGNVEKQYTNDCNHLSQKLGIAWEGTVGAVHSNIWVDKKRVADEADNAPNAVKWEDIHCLTHVTPMAVSW